MSKRWFPFLGRNRAAADSAPVPAIAPLFPARLVQPAAPPAPAMPDSAVIMHPPAQAHEDRAGEFILAGHSHIWAMGAPLGYKGPRGITPGEAFGRRGQYFVEQDGNGPTDAYWDDFIGHAGGRDAIIVWNGNQYWHCLLQQAPHFDFVDPFTSALDGAAQLVPRRLVEAWFEPSVSPLRDVLQRLQRAGVHSVTTVGTPPPPLDMQRFETALRQSAHFRAIAANQGVDIGDVSFTSPAILLKLWRVVQDLVAAVSADAACRFVPVPDWLCDEWGHLSPEYQFPNDCTHAAPPFGKAMLKLALQAEEV